MKFRLLVVSVILVVLSGCASNQTLELNPTQRSQGILELSSSADRAYKGGRWIEAALHYGKLSKLIPEDSFVWFKLGNTYAQQGYFTKAINAYEKSIEYNARQPKPWFNLSTAYLLRAQAALKQSWSQMQLDDPARKLVATRLQLLEALMHSGIDFPIQRARYP